MSILYRSGKNIIFGQFFKFVFTELAKKDIDVAFAKFSLKNIWSRSCHVRFSTIIAHLSEMSLISLIIEVDRRIYHNIKCLNIIIYWKIALKEKKDIFTSDELTFGPGRGGGRSEGGHFFHLLFQDITFSGVLPICNVCP